MAESTVTSSSSLSSRFCVVCRRHHEQGRSHIFTTKHKTKLNAILTKFSKKVRCARQQVQKPGVMDGELEPDSTLWCYFCEVEVAKHVTDGLTTIVWGSLLEHMASPQHHKKTRLFWWMNGADKKLLQNFLLFETEYIRYKDLVATALQQLQSKRELKLQEEVRQLKAKEESQLSAAREPPTLLTLPTPIYTTAKNQQGVLQNPTGWHEGRRVWGGGIVKYKAGSDQPLPWPIDSLHSHTSSSASCELSPFTGHKYSQGDRRGKITVAATGEQLASIQLPPQSLGQEEGNVHSGATPPWLKEDSDDGICKGGAPALIGPSEEEFLRHKGSNQPNRKNPKRVGADFHLRLQTPLDTGEWFPSFGRVWNSGPRSHSLVEFHKERASTSSRVATALSSRQHHSLHTITTPPPTSDMPGPSGLRTHKSPSNSVFSGAVEVAVHSGALLETGSLPDGVLPGEVRPYVRKRRGKSNKGTS